MSLIKKINQNGWTDDLGQHNFESQKNLAGSNGLNSLAMMMCDMLSKQL